MTIVVDHPNFQRSMRDDLAARATACLHCKGTGEKWRVAYSYPNHWNWRCRLIEGRDCKFCDGAGVFIEPKS